MAINPENKKNLDNGTWQLANHPFYKKHAQSLYQDSHDFIDGKVQKHFLPNEDTKRSFFKAFGDIQVLESNYREELEAEAVRIVSEIWGCDPNILDAKIVDGPEELDSAQDDENGESVNLGLKKIPKPTPLQQKRINQRILMNQLTQGAAVHQYITMHHMAEELATKIDKNLIKYYDKLASGSMSGYWMMDIEGMLKILGQHKAGSVKLEEINDLEKEEEKVEADQEEEEYEHEEEEEEEEKEDVEKPEVKVKARALCFPVLLQELAKGLMLLSTQHGINSLDKETAELVVHHADRMAHEPWQIKFGPVLWQKFIKVIPSNLASQMAAKMSMDDPDHVEKIIMTIIENPEEAKRILANYLEEDIKQPELDHDNSTLYLDRDGKIAQHKAGQQTLSKEIYDKLKEVDPTNKNDFTTYDSSGEIITHISNEIPDEEEDTWYMDDDGNIVQK